MLYADLQVLCVLGMGCLLFIAHARFNQQEVKCRLYGQCAVEKVTLNGVLQPYLTEVGVQRCLIVWSEVFTSVLRSMLKVFASALSRSIL